MRYAAIIKFVRNFCNIHFIIQQQFFYFFNFLKNDELLNGDAFDLGKYIRKIGIIKI